MKLKTLLGFLASFTAIRLGRPANISPSLLPPDFKGSPEVDVADVVYMLLKESLKAKLTEDLNRHQVQDLIVQLLPFGPIGLPTMELPEHLMKGGLLVETGMQAVLWSETLVKLVEQLIALNEFDCVDELAEVSQYALGKASLMIGHRVDYKSGLSDEWISKCEEVFAKCSKVDSHPKPVMSTSLRLEDYFLY